MKTREFQEWVWVGLSSLLLGAGTVLPTQGESLERAFARPPASARPWTYWMWMDGNLSREGITADLEAMQRAGLGGVIIMEVDVGIPKGPVQFMQAEWRALFKHVVAEAERLGLQITLNAGPGWTGSGGPWVKPEQSMQHLVASAIVISGPTNFHATLPQPAPRKPYFGTGGLPAELLKAQSEFYRDVAVLAFPSPTGKEWIADIEHKALYVRDPFSSMPGVKPFIPTSADYPAVPEGAAIASADIFDLTDCLDAQGSLKWTAPPGQWTLLRFGRTSTGANTRPAPAPGLGLECDKFDKAALEAHFEQFVGRLLSEVGPKRRPDAGWTSLHIDSWEMGAQNWTARFREEFKQRRGYDLLRYLPAYTGRVVDSREITERFLWDVRQTAQELVLENHAQHLKTLAHRNGFGLSIEPYDMNPTADLNLGAVADVPMCEFWANCFETWFSCFEAASIAHTGGQRIVAAESFTSDDKERWQFHPGNLKALGDWAFCAGVNRIAFHRYAHQPWLDRWPGMTMGPYGVHWERTQTWWDMVGEFHRYLARCQFLLRQGETVADILYLTPEGAPLAFRPPASAVHGHPPDRREYNFDACSPETLIARATVKRGQIVFPGGTSYRLLALPVVDTMTPRLLRKVKELVRAGATVYGAPPRKSPSLTAYPQCDAEVQTLAREIWGGLGVPAFAGSSSRPPEGGTPSREFRLGRGRVVWNVGAWQAGEPDAPVSGSLQEAKWIWFKEGSPPTTAPAGRRHFRRALVLPAGELESARIALTADNAFTLWINGRKIGAGDDFTVVQEFDVATSLRPGTNLLAVMAENGGDQPNPAGWIASLRVRLRDGQTFEVHSDSSWQAAARVTRDWQSSTASDSDWSAALELGAFGMSPWGRPARGEVFPEVHPDYNRLAAVLRADGVPPDFESDGPLRYTHRRDGGSDIYFVANRSAETCVATAAFRVRGKAPELWNPLTGTIRRAQTWEEREGRTFVPLKFEAQDSLFVVFRQSARPLARAAAGRNWDEFTAVAEVGGPWEVQFQPGRGAPGMLRLERLGDWSQHPDAGVRFFSGVATYRTTFVRNPESEIRGPKCWLDLGRVEVMARVRLNGTEAGTVWKPPFRVDLGKALKPGTNVLEIQVANLWPNRLIGDTGLPEEQRVAWTTWNPFTKDSPLLASGLLGPVTIVTTRDGASQTGAGRPQRAASPQRGLAPVRPFFAFCMDTHDAKKRSLSEQAVLLEELGYDGAGHLWLDGLEERIKTLDAQGLKLFQVYLRLDISPGAQEPYDPRLNDKLPLLQGRDAMLAVLVSGGRPSDETLDERAVSLLRELADRARPYGVRVALYPHVNDWLERVEDAVRVAKKVDRANLGVMFNLCHWLKVGEEGQLRSVLRQAKPHLLAVSINGSDHAAEIRAGTGLWIAPLDSGAFDPLDLLRALDEIGYRGPVGLQCYGIPGDARLHLERSMKAWRRLNDPSRSFR